MRYPFPPTRTQRILETLAIIGTLAVAGLILAFLFGWLSGKVLITAIIVLSPIGFLLFALISWMNDRRLRPPRR